MVEFKKLQVTPDGKFLEIIAVIKNKEYFDQVYIQSVTIDTQDTFIKYGPSSEPVYQLEYPEDSQYKRISLKIYKEDLTCNLNDNLFFVYVCVKGVPQPCTPCGEDNQTTLGVAFNMFPLYQVGFGYIKGLTGDCGTCKITKKFTDFILRLKAFQVALKTGNYVEAIKFWKKYLLKEKSTTSSGCGCNG